jgi:hypothetical protein
MWRQLTKALRRAHSRERIIARMAAVESAPMKWLAVLVLAFGVTAHAYRPLDVTGTWAGTYGETTLVQRGDHVVGRYPRGELDGTVEGRVLHFAWREGEATGHGDFTLAANGDLVGRWGSGESCDNGGAWLLTKHPVAPAPSPYR